MEDHKESDVSIDAQPEEEIVQRHQIIEISGLFQSLNAKALRFQNLGGDRKQRL